MIVQSPSRIRAVCALFAVGSLASVLTGCWVARADGTPAQAWGLNLLAWALGAGAAAVLVRLPSRSAQAWPVLTLAALLATLWSPGLSGVHRWMSLGPLRLNAAELALPLALAACAGLERRSLWRLVFPPAAAVLLAIQPDASQAAATAVGGAIVVLTSSRPRAKAASALVTLAAGVAAALRTDPLSPVANVEGIVGLAWALSPLIAAVGLIALAGAMLAPLGLARSPDARLSDAAFGLAAYLSVAAVAPAFGAFPVPLMGMGVSPILGAWLGFGWLMQIARRADAA